MIDFLKQYCKIISYSLLGLIFSFASFYLIVNLYHASEIRKTFVYDPSTNATMQKFQNYLTSIKENLPEIDANKYEGDLTAFQVMSADQKLKACYEELNNEAMQAIMNKNELTIVDIYNLREAFETEVVSKCVVTNLDWFAKAEKNQLNSAYLKGNQTYLRLYLDSILSDTYYLKKDLLNNSSYYFNTSLVTSTVMDKVKDGYYDVMASYTKVAAITDELAQWFSEETKGAR